jgi:hypothetical protein
MVGSFGMGLVYRVPGSVPVADVPDAPLSTVGVGVSNFDRFHALGAGVGFPCLGDVVAVGAAVASIPDQVGGFEGHGLVRFFHAVILQGRSAGSGATVDSASAVTGPAAGRSSHRHQWRRYPMPRHHGSGRAYARSVPPSYSERTSPRGSHCRHSTLHMPWRCCRGTRHSEPTGQHSRSRRLPNRYRC